MIEVAPGVEGLIFDCDGTLVNSMPIHWECWHGTFEKFGATCPHDFLERLKGVPTHGIIQQFNEKFGYNFDVEEFTEEKERLAQEKLVNVETIKPVVALVYKYHKKMPMAVASGGPYDTVKLSLDATELSQYFGAFVTADDPVDPKPAPGIFLEAARQIGVAPEKCQVFEDADMGLEAGRAAGMIVTDIRPYV